MSKKEPREFTASGLSFGTGTILVNSASLNETALLLIKNVSSTKSMHIFGGAYGTDSLSAKSQFRLYHTPTITVNGTSLPIQNRRVSGSPNVSEMEAYSLPTISSNGTSLGVKLVPPGRPSDSLQIDDLLIIDPGINILVTVKHSVANVTSHIALYWYEV